MYRINGENIYKSILVLEYLKEIMCSANIVVCLCLVVAFVLRETLRMCIYMRRVTIQPSNSRNFNYLLWKEVRKKCVFHVCNRRKTALCLICLLMFSGCVCIEREVEYAHAYNGSDNSAVWLWKFWLFALERSVFGVWKGKKRQRERIKALWH